MCNSKMVTLRFFTKIHHTFTKTCKSSLESKFWIDLECDIFVCVARITQNSEWKIPVCWCVRLCNFSILFFNFREMMKVLWVAFICLRHWKDSLPKGSALIWSFKLGSLQRDCQYNLEEIILDFCYSIAPNPS